jgi:uncharacterized C2H2 Zn-finger protein
MIFNTEDQLMSNSLGCSSTSEFRESEEGLKNSDGILCEHCGRCLKSTWEYRDHLASSFQLDQDALDFLSYTLDLPPILPQTASPVESEESKEEECPFCTKQFKGKRGLNQHIGKVHSKSRKRSQCKECGKKFRNKYALNFHIKQVHQKTTRVECSICSKVLYNKYVLERHVRMEHGDLGLTYV